MHRREQQMFLSLLCQTTMPLPFTAALLTSLLASSLAQIQSSTVAQNNSDSYNGTNTTSEPENQRDMEWFQAQPKEIIYVISGNRNFGGHGKQLFKWPILDIVRFTGEQFNETVTRFGVVWANAYITMNIVAPLLAKAREAEYMLENFLYEIPEPFPTALSGLEGSIEYAMNNIFSPDRDIIKVMVLLTHWNMLHADVNEFLKQNCYRVVLFVLVFPWPYQSCDNQKVQRMVLHMNNRLNITGLLKNQMAFCGRRIDMLEIFQPYIFDGYESFRTQVTWCDIHYPITTTTLPPPPCQWSLLDFQSLVTCHGTWVYYVLAAVIFFVVSFTCAISWISRSFIVYVYEYRKEKRRKQAEANEGKESTKSGSRLLAMAMRTQARTTASLLTYKKSNSEDTRSIFSRFSNKNSQQVSRDTTVTVFDATSVNETKSENSLVEEVEEEKPKEEKSMLLVPSPAVSRRKSTPQSNEDDEQQQHPETTQLTVPGSHPVRRKSVAAGLPMFVGGTPIKKVEAPNNDNKHRTRKISRVIPTGRQASPGHKGRINARMHHSESLHKRTVHSLSTDDDKRTVSLAAPKVEKKAITRRKVKSMQEMDTLRISQGKQRKNFALQNVVVVPTSSSDSSLRLKRKSQDSQDGQAMSNSSIHHASGGSAEFKDAALIQKSCSLDQ